MRQNRSSTLDYALYGVLLGLFLALVSAILDVLVQQLPLTLESVLLAQQSNPLLWVIDTTPLLLGFCGALVGKRQDALARLSESLVARDQEREQAVRELQALRMDLERQVAERAADLKMVMEVGRICGSLLELHRLGATVIELVNNRFDLHYIGLFLIDRSGEYAVLEAATGKAGRTMKDQAHKLEVGGQSLVGAACARRRAEVVLDVDQEPGHLDSPTLPRVRSELALPLMMGERVLGALDVQSTRPAAFSQEAIALLKLVAAQVAVAVDNARKLSEEAGLLEATSPLVRASRRLSAATATAEVAEAIVASVRETEADGCAVARFDVGADGGMQAVTLLADWTRGDQPRPSPDLFPLALSRNMIVIEDMAGDGHLSEGIRNTLLEMGICALILVPLRLGARRLGFIVIDRSRPGPFSPVTVRLYEILADQSAAALERARLLEESQQQAWREHALRSISDRITASFDLDTLLYEALEQTGRLVGAAGGYAELGTGEDCKVG
jgi:GAF domain-containing protein